MEEEKTPIPPAHNCPLELWGNMSTEDRVEYERCYNLLIKGNQWCVKENKKVIQDPKILAHNALITILPSFSKKIAS